MSNLKFQITPPGNRTQSDGLKVRYADHHTGEVLRDLKLQISNFRIAPPRSRTSSDSFERCRASVTLAGQIRCHISRNALASGSDRRQPDASAFRLIKSRN